MIIKRFFILLMLILYAAQSFSAQSDRLALLPAKARGEIILATFKYPTIQEAISHVNELKTLNKGNKRFVEEFVSKNIEKVCEALTDATKNVFRSLNVLKQYNFITDPQYESTFSAFRKKTPQAYDQFILDSLKFYQPLISTDQFPVNYLDIVKDFIAQGNNVNINEDWFVINAIFLRDTFLDTRKKAAELIANAPTFDLYTQNKKRKNILENIGSVSALDFIFNYINTPLNKASTANKISKTDHDNALKNFKSFALDNYLKNRENLMNIFIDISLYCNKCY